MIASRRGDNTLFTFAESTGACSIAPYPAAAFPPMKIFSLPASMVALFVVIAVLISAPPLPVDVVSAGVLDDKALESEARRGEQLAQKLGVTEVLGPLAPIALSPFFALTFMSGASLLAETGMVPDAIANNALLGAGSPLNNGMVFAGLLALTVLTTLPKLTKVTKPVAQVIDQVEAHSGIIAILAVQALSRMNLGDAPQESASVTLIQAGFITFTTSTALMVFSAINIFVINTVKFFFEMMIFLSPFPTVDAIFEAANKAAAGALLAIYVWSPFAATVINLAIFGIALLLFAWVRRRVVYLRAVFGDPILGWLAEAVFRRPAPTLTSTRLTGALAELYPQPTVVLKAFVGKRFGGLRMKTRGFLVQADGKLAFAARRLFQAPRVIPLPVAGHAVRIEAGFLANAVVVENDVGDVAARVVFSRRYSCLIEDLRRQLGARTDVAADTCAPQTAGMMAVSRSMGEAVKGGNREALRAELS